MACSSSPSFFFVGVLHKQSSYLSNKLIANFPFLITYACWMSLNLELEPNLFLWEWKTHLLMQRERILAIFPPVLDSSFMPGSGFLGGLGGFNRRWTWESLILWTEPCWWYLRAKPLSGKCWHEISVQLIALNQFNHLGTVLTPSLTWCPAVPVLIK